VCEALAVVTCVTTSPGRFPTAVFARTETCNMLVVVVSADLQKTDVATPTATRGIYVPHSGNRRDHITTYASFSYGLNKAAPPPPPLTRSVRPSKAWAPRSS
jgi:hypothetical protein